jgi:hypothetical protein
MDIQSILSLAIGVIFMSFVSLVFVDFVNGLFWLPYSYSAIAIAPIASTNQVIAAAVTVSALLTIATPESEPEFAQLPSPWDLDTDLPPTAIQPEPVVLQFPTLKLLLPAASVVQPKAATTKSTKSAKPKSTKTSKTSQPKTTVTPRKSRQKSVA